MKKFLVLITALFILAGAALAQVWTFVPVYVVADTVYDTPEATADGRMVVVYKDDAEYAKGIFTYAYVTGNTYVVNAASTTLTLTVGDTYEVGVVQGADGYGAGPVKVTISGKGYDIAPPMTMCKGCGPLPVKAPIIEQVRFDERVYFEELVKKGEKFYTSSTPKVTALIKGADTAGVNVDRIFLVVNEGRPGAPQPYTMAVPSKSYVAGTSVIKSLTAVFTIPDSEPLPEDPDADTDSTVTIKAQNTAGIPAEKVCTVTVAGGPMRVIGDVVVFPSPFSPSKDKELEIQYTLSQAGNVTIYIVNIAGETVKRISCAPGEEGGNAGRNKVKWNGRYETGEIAGNGVYVGTILDRDRNKLLARFKFTIFD